MKSRYYFTVRDRCRRKRCCNGELKKITVKVGKLGTITITGTCAANNRKTVMLRDKTWLRKDAFELAISGRPKVCKETGCDSYARFVLEIGSDGKTQLRAECPDCGALRATPWFQSKLQTIRPKNV